MTTAEQLAASERAVLASVLDCNGDALPPTVSRLLDASPESWSDPRHSAIGCAVRGLRREGRAVTPDLLLPALASDRSGAALLLGTLGNGLPIGLAEIEAQSLWSAYQIRRARSVFDDSLHALEAAPAQASSIIACARRTLESLDGETSQNALPPIVDAADFVAETIPLPAELVCGILHRGSKMVLGGGSKTFKTWTLLDLAVSVASGEPWLSFKTCKGRVLFLNLEIQEGFFQHRIEAVAREKLIKLKSGQLDVWNLRGHCAGYEIVLPRIAERVKSTGYVLIVLDPIYKLYGQTDENSAGAVAQLLNGIETLTVQSGAAVAFGAHYSKGNQAGKEAIDRISGSGVFARDPDSILNFTRHEERDAFTVEATLRNFKPVAPFVVRWQFPLMRRDASLDPTKLKQAGGRPKLYTVDRILPYLKGRKLSSRNWFQECSPETGISKTRFYALLEEAKRLPNMKQTQAGEWFCEDTPSK